MSDWIVHFVHDRNPDNEPQIGEETSAVFPYTADTALNSRFDIWELLDDQYPIGAVATAQEVLLKILNDGHIRAGWSFRGGRPTIYGPKAAACFTEMPLYALLQYGRSRNDRNSVGAYAIAVPKREFFAAGGRPAIYGLSGAPKEKTTSRGWPRLLDPDCGIGEREQYRYVSMRLGTSLYDIDWSHEREWRRCDCKDQYDVPGLPIWLKLENQAFSRVLVIVQTEGESEQVLNVIKRQYDVGWYDPYEYDRSVLKSTAVISLDRIKAEVEHERMYNIRLDDIPAVYMRDVTLPRPSAEYMSYVRSVIDDARAAAGRATATYREKCAGGGFYCGWAMVMVGKGQSELVQALLELRYAEPYLQSGYHIFASTDNTCETSSLDESRAAAQAAIAVIRSAFPTAEPYIYVLDD